jgi:hypothetical protein
VGYLEKYDLMKNYLDNYFQMPDATVALMIRYLEQGQGHLWQKAKSKEFQDLTEAEIEDIENKYQEIFHRSK